MGKKRERYKANYWYAAFAALLPAVLPLAASKQASSLFVNEPNVKEFNPELLTRARK